MHESGLAAAVLAALREHSGGCGLLRVHLFAESAPDDLARRIAAHLSGAQPALPVPVIEVVPRAQTRICSACAGTWVSAEPDPPCPSCGGVALPPVHDHRIELEFLPAL